MSQGGSNLPNWLQGEEVARETVTRPAPVRPPPQETPTRPADPSSPPQQIYGRVIVTDIDMPFRSMVNFIMKWMLATIPALILASVLGAFLSAFAWLLFGILVGLMSR